jgi:hypothetical protein
MPERLSCVKNVVYGEPTLPFDFLFKNLEGRGYDDGGTMTIAEFRALVAKEEAEKEAAKEEVKEEAAKEGEK